MSDREIFNHSHYIKVRGARKKLGLSVYTKEILENHRLIGKTIINTLTSKKFSIEKVIKYWHHGYYFGLLLIDDHKSSVLIFWDDINCHEKMITDSIKKNRKEYMISEGCSKCYGPLDYTNVGIMCIKCGHRFC